MTRRSETKANRADRLAHELEHATDLGLASSSADHDQLARGVPLADAECPHMQLGACADCEPTKLWEVSYGF